MGQVTYLRLYHNGAGLFSSNLINDMDNLLTLSFRKLLLLFKMYNTWCLNET